MPLKTSSPKPHSKYDLLALKSYPRLNLSTKPTLSPATLITTIIHRKLFKRLTPNPTKVCVFLTGKNPFLNDFVFISETTCSGQQGTCEGITLCIYAAPIDVMHPCIMHVPFLYIICMREALMKITTTGKKENTYNPLYINALPNSAMFCDYFNKNLFLLRH